MLHLTLYICQGTGQVEKPHDIHLNSNFNIHSFSSVPGPNTVNDNGMTISMIMMAWMVIALVLFLMRPASLRGYRTGGKSQGPHNVSWLTCITTKFACLLNYSELTKFTMTLAVVIVLNMSDVLNPCLLFNSYASDKAAPLQC